MIGFNTEFFLTNEFDFKNLCKREREILLEGLIDKLASFKIFLLLVLGVDWMCMLIFKATAGKSLVLVNLITGGRPIIERFLLQNFLIDKYTGYNIWLVLFRGDVFTTRHI
jgi:putative flippase GtrA